METLPYGDEINRSPAARLMFIRERLFRDVEHLPGSQAMLGKFNMLLPGGALRNLQKSELNKSFEKTERRGPNGNAYPLRTYQDVFNDIDTIINYELPTVTPQLLDAFMAVMKLRKVEGIEGLDLAIEHLKNIFSDDSDTSDGVAIENVVSIFLTQAQLSIRKIAALGPKSPENASVRRELVMDSEHHLTAAFNIYVLPIFEKLVLSKKYDPDDLLR